jgi:hypothetical protein
MLLVQLLTALLLKLAFKLVTKAVTWLVKVTTFFVKLVVGLLNSQLLANSGKKLNLNLIPLTLCN